MLTMHHLTTTLLIPTLLWASEIWWTGARHTIDNFNPTYRRFTSLITNLPSWTRTDRLHYCAGLPLLGILLDHTARKFSLRLVRADNLLSVKKTYRNQKPTLAGVGHGRIRDLLNAITPDDARVENDTGPSEFLNIEHILIDPNDKDTTT